MTEARESVAEYEAAWTADNGSPESSAMLAWALVALIHELRKEVDGASCSRGGGCAPRVRSPEAEQLSERVLQLTDVALAVHPDNAQTWRIRYHALYSLGRYEEGLQACERALSLEPSDLHSQWGLASCLYYLRRYRKCAQAYERLFESDPKSKNALHWANVAYGLAGDPENAQRISELGVAHFPGDAEFVRMVYHGRMTEERFEEALCLARKSAQDNPDDYRPRVGEGHALLRLERRDEAIEAFEDAIRRAPDCSNGYAGLLQALGADAAPERIQKVFRDALASGDFTGVDFSEVSYWAAHNGYEIEALAILDKLSESNPDSTSVYARYRGEALEKLGQTAEAEKQFALAAEKWEQHLDAILADFSEQNEETDEKQRDSWRKTKLSVLEYMLTDFDAGKKSEQVVRCLEAIQELDPERADELRAKLASI